MIIDKISYDGCLKDIHSNRSLCSWPPWSSNSTYFSKHMNEPIQNNSDLIVYIFCVLIEAWLVSQSLKIVLKIYSSPAQQSELERIKIIQNSLLIAGLISQQGFIFAIVEFLAGDYEGFKNSTYFNFFGLNMPSVILNFTLIRMSLNQWNGLSSKWFAVFANFSSIILGLNVLFLVCVTFYHCCKQLIDAYQYAFIAETTLICGIYTFTSFKYKKHNAEIDDTQKCQINSALIIIGFALILKIVYQILRIISNNDFRCWFLTTRETSYHFIIQLIFIIFSDFSPRWIIMRKESPEEREYRRSHEIQHHINTIS